MHTPEQRMAEELGISLEQAELIVKNHWESVKHYLQRPHEVKKGVYLEEFIKIKINAREIKKWLTSGRKTLDTRKRPDRAYFINIYNYVVDGTKQEFFQDEGRNEEDHRRTGGNGEEFSEE